MFDYWPQTASHYIIEMESPMTDKITFLNKDYDRSTLEAMDDAALLELRNLVATNLGVATVKAFKDHTTAVEQTLKALQKYEKDADGEAPAAKVKAPKVPKEPKDRKLAKPAEAQHVKRPTKKMFSLVKMIKPFDGEEDRAHRSGNYKDGMMIIDAIEGEGTLPWDIYNWEKSGYMSVTEPTDDEYASRRAAWYQANGREDPDLAKLDAIKKRAADKEAKDSEREAKKAEREQAKAEKAEAAAKAKAEKEAAKAAKVSAAE